MNIPVLIEKPCFSCFDRTSIRLLSKRDRTRCIETDFCNQICFCISNLYSAHTPHEMMMHIYDTDQVLQNLDVSTTSCSIFVPSSFRARITTRRIRMILPYDRALAAKPAQRYGESAEWETSPPQNLEEDI